jgi:hypothetical protein
VVRTALPVFIPAADELPEHIAFGTPSTAFLRSSSYESNGATHFTFWLFFLTRTGSWSGTGMPEASMRICTTLSSIVKLLSIVGRTE